jgi:sugar phosphate permease
MLSSAVCNVRNSRLLQGLGYRLRAYGGDQWVTRSPFFYGWTIMVAGTIGMVMTSPGQTYAVSIFIDPLIEGLGISRSLISGLYTIGTLVGSFALPFLGRSIDRYGPRRMVVIIALVFGLACMYMGTVQNALMLGFGFVAIRMFGQGGLGLVSQNVINQWWVVRRGTIMGISGLVMSLVGLAAFPRLIHLLLAAYGWRTTYFLLGALVLAIMLPVGYFFFRDRPERFGMQPDGGVVGANAATKVTTPEENWTLDEVVRTPIFWVFSLSLSSLGMLSTGLFFHNVSIFADNGLDASVAAMIFLPIAITTALVNFGSGLLVDRIPVRVVLAGALVLQAGALLMAQAIATVPLALAYGILVGASGGLQRTISSVVWATYFGRRYLGSITGVTSTIMIAGSALGPLPFGISRDLWGSYNPALVISALLPAGLAILCLFFARPRRVAIHDVTQ